jgi:adenosylcobyric acid synthase
MPDASLPLAPVLMVLGTSSHAGKSTLAAALCRIFADEGMRVAPFKAQNMSLNSAATIDGGEIGRAQMLQAQAARVTATVRMNPILLKPQGERTSQVVVLGRAIAVEEARDYYRRRDVLWPVVAASLDALRAEHDLVVAEGAGSPAEINLRDRDIVNMRVACHARAACLLVGDVERGGVFASLAGTMALLEPDERPLIRGFVINKFRGDPSLLEPGPAQLEAITGVPTLGVVPYFRDIQLPDEDSLGLPASSAADGSPDAAVDIAVIRLPHIANFDDMDPLRRTPGVRVRFVDAPETFGTPDLIVLPGTKTTVADLAWLRQRGLAAEIAARRAAGTPILGICGGFQMLGRRIRDDDRIETADAEVDGLALLDVTTSFAAEKVVRQRRGVVRADVGLLAGGVTLAVSGYEIHHGRTISAGRDARAPFSLEETDGAEWPDGAVSADGLVVGTYLHGILHDAALRTRLLANVAARRGVVLPPAVGRDLDAELDALADHVRRHVDIGAIRRWLS